nr:hypothetical protein [Tanacetum cinerariifolium]
EKFPLPVKEVPTASEESSHCQKKREATAMKIALLLKSKRNCQSKSDDNYTKLVPHVTPCYQEDEEESPKAAVWNFKAEGSETLEQTFNRLQVIVGQLQFMDVEIKQDDLNQKFLTSLAPEWLMHIIVWRNMSDLDTMSLDDLYKYLKVYESEVQKKSEPNPQNMAFISLAKHSRGNEDVNTASFSTAITNVPTASA